jgi:hypothetical protein
MAIPPISPGFGPVGRSEVVLQDKGKLEAGGGGEPLHILLLEDSPLDAELIHAKLLESELPFNLVREGDACRFSGGTGNVHFRFDPVRLFPAFF